MNQQHPVPSHFALSLEHSHRSGLWLNGALGGTRARGGSARGSRKRCPVHIIHPLLLIILHLGEGQAESQPASDEPSGRSSLEPG